jgi:hypothetical protein
MALLFYLFQLQFSSASSCGDGKERVSGATETMHQGQQFQMGTCAPGDVRPAGLYAFYHRTEHL